MSRFDRLSSLIARFTLTVSVTDPAQANLVVYQHRETAEPCRILMTPHGVVGSQCPSAESIMLSALTEWGGGDNPLFSALPEQIELSIHSDPQMRMLVQLIQSEAEAQRCGSGAVLNRLGEVLIVRLLRTQLEQGSTAVGLLGGLADARLSRAIVAIHEAPGKPWRNEEMAETAGLSLSRFAELFLKRVGETPQAYLRRWRMLLARQDVQQGERIQTVARRYGYGSSEALGRAFRRQFGDSPIRSR